MSTMIGRRYDGVVLLGFGGPTGPEEIRPFLDRVLRGRRIPQARYEEVVGHYLRIGGRSPYNERTQRQAEALQRALARRGLRLHVDLALRNSHPFLEDVLARLAAAGARSLLAVVLAAHRGSSGWDRYVHEAEMARRHIGPSAPVLEYLPPFYDHPLFVGAQAARVYEALQRLGRRSFTDVALVFTAHSIPRGSPGSDLYTEQVRRSAALVAELVKAPSWSVTYQSRSGAPGEPWLEPDVREELRRVAASQAHEAIVVPIGFLCDHVEVLYDLDVEAAAVAASCGIRMVRAPAVNTHPLFIDLLTYAATGDAYVGDAWCVSRVS